MIVLHIKLMSYLLNLHKMLYITESLIKSDFMSSVDSKDHVKSNPLTEVLLIGFSPLFMYVILVWTCLSMLLDVSWPVLS